MEPLNVLLYGVGYFPRVVGGDKTFFYRLVRAVAERVGNLAIVSVNYRNEREIQRVNRKAIPIYNLKRALHYGDPRRYYTSSSGVFHHLHKHKPVREAMERQLTALASLPTLVEAVRENDIRVIHFMDNCGLAMVVAKRIFRKVGICCSAPNYYRRSFPYNLYPRYSFAPLDKIVPYTEAYRDRLLEMGVPARKLELIRWGVPRQETRLSQTEKAHIRRRLGLMSDSKLLVWCGFIQQVNEEAFFEAIRIAKQIVRNSEDTEFVFAFKPLCYRDGYAVHEEGRIKIVPRTENVLHLLETADFLFSPIVAVDSTVSPPLTWLEAMSLGTPVITTEVPGVAELVTQGETGYVADSLDSLPALVLAALEEEHYGRVSEQARHIVSRKYSIEDAGERHINMWQSITQHAD